MVVFMCPGCRDTHSVYVDGPKAWKFNEDLRSPTLTPSIRVQWVAYDPEDLDAKALESICHSFVTDGRITYCSDSTHPLRGQTVDLLEGP